MARDYRNQEQPSKYFQSLHLSLTLKFTFPELSLTQDFYQRALPAPASGFGIQQILTKFGRINAYNQYIFEHECTNLLNQDFLQPLSLLEHLVEQQQGGVKAKPGVAEEGHLQQGG